MKLLVLSDIHGHEYVIRRFYEKIDFKNINAIIICGDLTNFGSFQRVEEILKELSSLGRMILFVPGNCDPKGLAKRDGINDAINLHGKHKKINSLSFIGVGGSNYTPFNTIFELSEREFKDTIECAYKKLALNERFILISHTPPFNTKVDATAIGIHAGSKELREFIEKTKPLLVICGHIHEARGIDKINETLIANPGPAYKGFYILVEINREVKVETCAL